jgi:hypothetical protein
LAHGGGAEVARRRSQSYSGRGRSGQNESRLSGKSPEIRASRSEGRVVVEAGLRTQCIGKPGPEFHGSLDRREHADAPGELPVVPAGLVPLEQALVVPAIPVIDKARVLLRDALVPAPFFRRDERSAIFPYGGDSKCLAFRCHRYPGSLRSEHWRPDVHAGQHGDKHKQSSYCHSPVVCGQSHGFRYRAASVRSAVIGL